MQTWQAPNGLLLTSHAQQICTSAIKPDPFPQSAQAVTRAYEARAAPKLVNSKKLILATSDHAIQAWHFTQMLLQISQLKSTDLLIRQKALLAAAQLLGSKLSYEQCLAAGIVPALALLLRVRPYSCLEGCYKLTQSLE